MFAVVLVVVAAVGQPPAAQKKDVLVLPPGSHVVSAEFSLPDAAGGFAVPGSRVDVLGTAISNGRASAFVLLQDVLVIAVDSDSRKPLGVTISFVTNLDGAKVLALAKERKCGLSVALRKPGDKPDGTYDVKKVAAFLEGLNKPVVEVAPPPRAK